LKQVEYQFYPTLIKHVERWPMKPSRQCNLPRLIALPDFPVAKHSKKLSARDVTINDGLHVHAIMIATGRRLRTRMPGLDLVVQNVVNWRTVRGYGR
jgi:hypothetical protein